MRGIIPYRDKKGTVLFMKVKIIGSVSAAVLIAFTLISVLPVNGEEKIYSDLIRLHVIANSDSDSDQELKLEVRDAVLESAAELNLSGGKENAGAVIESSKKRLESAAYKVIQNRGYDYPVCVELGEEHYPERNYEDFVLPEGNYTSLRVIIGEGEGHNWWCVLYPPLCTAVAGEREDTFISAGFTDDQYRAITESGKTKYKVRFKIIEILEEIFGTDGEK